MIQSKSGVIYCAIGKKYLEQALLSAKSIKEHNPNILCSVCTNIDTKDSIWDKIISIEKSNVEHNQYMLDKLLTLSKSPYEKTLYLDADTFIMDDISELFMVLNKFDISICHGHNKQRRYEIQYGLFPYRGKKSKVALDSIPQAFAPVQGGLLLFNNNELVKNWISDLTKLYIKKDFFDDQVSMREALWESNINFYILPYEYNFNSIADIKRWKKDNFKQARPKIFHYTKHKNSNIPKLVKRTLKSIF